MTIEMKMENPPTQKTKKNNPTLLNRKHKKAILYGMILLICQNETSNFTSSNPEEIIDNVYWMEISWITICDVSSNPQKNTIIDGDTQFFQSFF